MSDISLRDRIEQKIEEAEFFLDKLRGLESANSSMTPDDSKKYRYFASAFLNAIRSPQQYICDDMKEADSSDPTKKTIPVIKQNWYSAAIEESTTLRFIKNERDANIHEISTTPIEHVKKEFSEPAGPSSTSSNVVWTKYNGVDKRVLSIAETAITEVRKLVADGFSKGHIT